MIRVLVAEDSAVQRELLLFVLDEAGEFDVVGIAADGMEAVERARALRPDIILMDCHMPRLDGIGATRQIMQTCPAPIVIVSASLVPEDVKTSFDALRNGALSVLAKPVSPDSPDFARLSAELVQTLRLMSEVKVVRRWPEQPPLPAALSNLARTRIARMRLLAIAGSTGAPAVIADILAAIASELDVPVLVVQHISPGFAAGFASWLAGRSGLPAALAEHGQRAQAGHVYVAPDDRHLGVDRTGRIVLSDDQPEDGFRPSATYLFRSVANAYGRSALGVLLSGMGRDGAGGLSELHRLGGTTIAQDEASCVVFGMPREAIRLGAATLVLPPVEIAGAIVASSHAEQEDRRERAVDRD